jgi:hypothetical protein
MARGIKSGAKHADGEPVKDAAAKEAAEGEAAPETPLAESVVDTERMVRFDHPGFSRMRTEWAGPDRAMIQRIQSTIEGAILNHFEDAYLLMYEIYDIVREPQVKDDGEIVTDNFGFTVFQRSPTGAYYEDWARLGHVQREHLIYRLTTSLFEWSQRAANLWTEAMFAKAIWQEEFAHYFDVPVSGTVDDRNAKGNLGSAEARYFAIFTSALSRKADAIVRNMELLNQRLKDTSTN